MRMDFYKKIQAQNEEKYLRGQLSSYMTVAQLKLNSTVGRSGNCRLEAKEVASKRGGKGKRGQGVFKGNWLVNYRGRAIKDGEAFMLNSE